MMANLSKKLHSEFVKKVEEVSGESLSACYQCGTCSAGCPMAFAMDILPRQIMHLAHLGREEEIAKCQSVWVCASCLACTARCPRGIDIGKIMEALRQLTMRKNIDHVKLSKIPRESLAELPQIALVSSFRKHTA